MSPLKLSSSVTAALTIAGVVFLYFLVRGVFGDQNAPEGKAETISDVFTVVAEPIEAQEWRDVVRLRGRTKAIRTVSVKAETNGVVAETPAVEGDVVKEGDVLCRLRVDARQAALAEARAAQKRARLDFDAASKLADEGFRSDTSVAALRAALDLANASVERAELDLDRIDITAPFDGAFNERLAEVGDFLRVGDPCGVVIQQSPVLIVGGISEKDVAKLKVGDRGVARLATGETVEGKVRFVAAAADPATRTFDVELEVSNEEGAVRDGVTADFEVYATSGAAHLLPRSALTLDDEGRIGVRTVMSDQSVAFTPVNLLGDGPEGVWVDGLDGAPTVILRGQDFVRAGQKVKVAPRPAAAADEFARSAG
ncbi:MAG: efflux RND transporter periplasmic adaptor subunit [Alphaproteobacteria bacterium]|nr:efflux RND transporter periplasmic adaptor subunit [Alphaproteobacteria bacterium]